MIDFELVNELLKVGIGACIFIVFACFTYTIKNILIGCFYLAKSDDDSFCKRVKAIIQEDKNSISSNGNKNEK